MNLSEIIEKGYRRVRHPQWHKDCYIKLFIVNGMMGPWAKLFDRPGCLAMNKPIPMVIPMTSECPEEDTWEIYSGTNDIEDKSGW